MTTTLWIVIMIAMAVIGAWVGYYEGYKSGYEGGVRVAKGNTLFDGIERIVESVNNDPMQCVSVCSKRRTPNEDTNVKLRKIACKFTDEENARKVEQSNIEAAESAKEGGFPKSSTLYGVPLDGSLKELGFTVEEGDEACAFCFEDRDGYPIWLITHKNHPPVSLADNKIQWLDMTSEPDCEGDDCRIVGKTFCGGDGIE